MKNKISKALELAEQSEVLTLGLSAGSSIQLWHEENAKELRRLDAVEKAADAVAEHFQQQIDRLRSELSTERMRLEACGVVARADTPESAAVARDMLRAELRSKSCDDVARLVDECINLRSELEAARGRVEALTKSQEPVAYAIFAENGNIRLWATEPQHVNRIAQEKGLQLVKLYANPHP